MYLILRALQVPLPDSWANNRVPMCVCVCIFTHIHPHTLPPASKIEKTQTTPLSFYPRRCKTSSDSQSAGLSIPRSSVRIRQKPKKPKDSNPHGIELHRPSSKGTKLLFQVIKAIINQFVSTITPHAKQQVLSQTG